MSNYIVQISNLYKTYVEESENTDLDSGQLKIESLEFVSDRIISFKLSAAYSLTENNIILKKVIKMKKIVRNIIAIVLALQILGKRMPTVKYLLASRLRKGDEPSKTLSIKQLISIRKLRTAWVIMLTTNAIEYGKKTVGKQRYKCER